MRHQGGFALFENMLGMALVMMAVASVVPAFMQNLRLTDMLWEHRQAMKVIEQTLDQACNAAQTSANFNNLINTSVPAADFAPTPELVNAVRTVTCRKGPAVTDPLCTTGDTTTNLKRFEVTVSWKSRGQWDATESSAPYLISRIGACGTGA